MTQTTFTETSSATTTAHAFGASAPDAPLGALEIQRRAVGPNDVRIDIKFCGVCHSDIHFTRGEWGEIPYPAVPGHEIAGIVAEVGSEVTRFAPGDRVGVGCMVNSCRECENCEAGDEQYCLRGNTQTYGSIDRDGTITYGGYSDHVVVDQDFVLNIPDGLELDAAAPLLCAGITTYSPLRHWNAGPGKRVAVVGLGGLGHMAVKLAHCHGRRGHGAVAVAAQAGRRAQARCRRLPRHERRRYLRRARRALRPHRQHRQRGHRHRPLPDLAQDGRRPRQRRRAARAAAYRPCR